MASLREEFEPLLLSPDGLHPDAEACAEAWDREKTSEAELEAMIALADEWLRRCTRSRSVNVRIPSSFGLKNIASRYHGGAMILNGCFLMAAARLGFQMERQAPRYVAKIGRVDANAFLNITAWPSDGTSRPGTERKEAEHERRRFNHERLPQR
jgi:hypothetical protein